MLALEISHLSNSYGEFLALDRVCLQVEPGESFALLGPNGSGKTTTIKLIMGLLQPSSGTASIAGLDCFAQRAPVKRRCHGASGHRGSCVFEPRSR